MKYLSYGVSRIDDFNNGEKYFEKKECNIQHSLEIDNTHN